MDNSEKLATLGTQNIRRRHTTQKHNTIFVGHHYTHITQIMQIRHKPSYKQSEVKMNIVKLQVLVSRNYHTPHFNVLFTSIVFIFNKISLLFHLFILNLTCSCPYSYNLMLTTTYACRPYIYNIMDTSKLNQGIKKVK